MFLVGWVSLVLFLSGSLSGARILAACGEEGFGKVLRATLNGELTNDGKLVSFMGPGDEYPQLGIEPAHCSQRVEIKNAVREEAGRSTVTLIPEGTSGAREDPHA